MTFAPAINAGGIAGWRILERSGPAQLEAFSISAQFRREVAYFADKIASVTSPDQLAKDHTLWKVALGAFGLDEEAGKKFFIKKVLGEGTDNPESFANKLVDTRYRELAAFFGFGNPAGSRTGLSGFADEIAGRYLQRQFEVAVGATNNDLRLAMVFRREIGALAGSTSSDSTTWLKAMGNLPMRRFLEQALNVPKQVATLGLDRQREIFQEHMRRAAGTGSLSALQEPAKRDRLIQLFFFRSTSTDINLAGTAGSAALSLLRNATSIRV